MDLGLVSLKTSMLMIGSSNPARVSRKKVPIRATVENAK